MSHILDSDIKVIFEAFKKIDNLEDFKNFICDLCTIKEIESMAQRINAATLLLKGETYDQIMEHTDISSATLSRVSKCVHYGEGYKKILQ